MASFVLIDDSMVMRTILRYTLESCGAVVLAEGKDVGQALALTRERQPDALTIAASLRGESGLAVLSAVRQLAWRGKIFFVATAEEAAEERAARQAGVDGVLRKPFTLEQVSVEIDRVMGGGP